MLKFPFSDSFRFKMCISSKYIIDLFVVFVLFYFVGTVDIHETHTCKHATEITTMGLFSYVLFALLNTHSYFTPAYTDCGRKKDEVSCPRTQQLYAAVGPGMKLLSFVSLTPWRLKSTTY